MSASELQATTPTTPEYSGVEFGLSSDGLPVARIGDMAFAMVPGRDGLSFLASAWRVPRPLTDLKRDDFCSHHGIVADEAVFRDRMIEQAEHSRELRALSRQEVRIHCDTPWGASQGATIYAEGVVSHFTAGHGGFKLSVDRNRHIHSTVRKSGGWYEEDAEWAIVALTFPHLFTCYERKCADKTIRDSWPEAWEVISGRSLAPGESWRKDQIAFEREHASDWIVISAILSVHQPGMTEVVATPAGKRDGRTEERRFLVPGDVYSTRGPFGFVIDEARHVVYDGPSSFIGWQPGRTRP